MSTTSTTNPPAVAATDDLFRHVNAAWLASTPIDDDKSSAGSFVTLNDQAEQSVREIIEDLAGRPGTEGEDSKIAELYRAFMDTETIERLGAEPLAPLLQGVDAITSTTDLARHWGWSLRHGFRGLISLWPDADMDDPSRYTTMVMQSGLGLPDRDYYLDDAHAEIREQYRAHVARMLALAGLDDAEGQADAVLALETEIARRHWDKVRNRDMPARHNPVTWQEMVELAPALHVDELVRGAGLEVARLDRLNVNQPSFLTEVAELVDEAHLPQWRSWARWQVVTAMAPYLSSAFVDENFEFYSHTLQGTPKLRDRWKRGVDLVEELLGEAVGRLYVERHFPPASKQAMDELVANLLAAYGESIRALDWMGEQTRDEALHKLAGFRPKIGFPAHWREYSGLQVVPGDLVGSVLAGASHEFDHWFGKLGTPVDPDEWFMLPQTVNAYYHPMRNEIVFPAAILQPPFFDAAAGAPTNYGAIGAVIGHEIGHGFDDQGSTCDGDGRLRNWWTDADREAFTKRTGALIGQYDALTPRQLEADDPKPHVNGALTIGENIGDLGGLAIGLKALRIALGTEPTADQVRELFTGYARIWCAKYRDDRARQLLMIDVHSPAEFRCNQIARNVDAFHEAFDTKPGDGMWLDPAERVSIW